MSAWDDPITHIRELEGKVSRIKALMRELADSDSLVGRHIANELRDRLEDR